MHERIIIPESVFSVAEDGSEYVTAVRGRWTLMRS